MTADRTDRRRRRRGICSLLRERVEALEKQWAHGLAEIRKERARRDSVPRTDDGQPTLP